jgi:ABC-type uncharacterized transport system permease subunit
VIKLEARPEPSRVAGWLSPLLAAAATLVVGFILFTAMGKDPWTAFHAFFVKPVATLYGVGELLLKATPLMLIAVGLAAGYRANVWNIGAEGQLTMGAIFGGDADAPTWVYILGSMLALKLFCSVLERSVSKWRNESVC